MGVTLKEPAVDGECNVTPAQAAKLNNLDLKISTLKALIDAIEVKLDSPDNFKADVSALAAALVIADAEIAAIEAKLDNPDDFKADVSALALEATLIAVLAEVAGLDGVAMRGTENALLASGYTAPDNTGIVAIKAITDKLTRARYQHEPPATALLEEVQVLAGANNRDLGTIVVAGIPVGATVTEAYIDFEFRAVENIDSGAINKLSGAQYIQIKKGVGGAFTPAITLSANSFTLAANTREGGMIIKGNIDVSGTVTADDAYYIQWTASLATSASLYFNEVQARLRITYSL